MATDPAIGTRIRKRRQILHMTQDALAATLGVAKSTVANWESGKHFPLRHLGAVEAVLGVSLDGAPADDDLGRPRDQWEASVLADIDLPAADKRQLVTDYRAVRAAYQPIRQARRESALYRPSGTAG